MLTVLATMLALAAPMTGEATEITATSAKLNGTVDAAGSASFQYGLSDQYGGTTPTQAVVAGPVSATVSPLTPNTTYHFRLVAVNASGTAFGVDKTFRTG